MKRTVLAVLVALMAAGCSTMGWHRALPSYNVFFHNGSADLTPEAAAIVDQAAAAIRQGHPGSVIVSAGTSPGDSNNFAEARFKIVQAQLVAKGVSTSTIVRATLVETPVELGPTADRRVEIKLLADATP